MTSRLILSLFTGVFILSLLFGCANTRQARNASENSGDIAELTIYSYDGAAETEYLIKCYGHAFLGIENTGGQDIEIYNYKLRPGEEVTFSWWAVDAHMGVWFNLEDSYIDLYGRYQDRYSLSIGLNSAQLEAINLFIAQNDYYTPLSNCSKMVTGCWNEAASDTEKLAERFLATPARLCEDIRDFDSYEYERPINAGGGICYYDKDSGEFITYIMEDRQ